MSDNTQAPVTDDQELAKVLASMSDDANKQQPVAAAPAAAEPAAAAPPADDVPPIPATLPSAGATSTPPTISSHGTTINPPSATPPAVSASATPSDLDNIKRQALDELRPIVGKLDLPAEDKFDALLLVIRSSDDQSLVKAAYEAAEGIGDEARKAQALLDIVKEIEYFSSQGK